MVIDIQLTATGYNTLANIVPPAVYLDHCAIREISQSDAWSGVFKNAITNRGTLLVSLMNFLEVSRNTDRSFDDILHLLDAIGEHWYPLCADPASVERRSQDTDDPFGERLLLDLITPLATGLGFQAMEIRHPSAAVFLRHIAKYTEVRSRLQDQLNDLQKDLLQVVQDADHWRTRDLSRLRSRTGKSRCAYVFDLSVSLLSRQRKVSQNDIADLFHFVVPMVRADFVVLDRKWADFARQLRLPHGYARAYPVAKLEGFFNDLVVS